jgi:hypothetical protein
MSEPDALEIPNLFPTQPWFTVIASVSPYRRYEMKRPFAEISVLVRVNWTCKHQGNNSDNRNATSEREPSGSLAFDARGTASENIMALIDLLQELGSIRELRNKRSVEEAEGLWASLLAGPCDNREIGG